MRRMGDIMMKQPGVENAVGFPGLSINGFTNSSNAGIVFAALEIFDERKSPSFSGGAIAGALNQQFAAIQDAFIVIFPPPPVQGLGTTGGFKLYLEDRASLGYEALDQATKAFLAKAYQAPELAGLFSTYQVNVPQIYADLDRTKARQLGVPVTEVFDTMQIYLGSLYVNDFNKFGRTYSVRVQADAPYRARAEDVGPAQGALEHRRDGAALDAHEGASGCGPRARDALQRLPRRRHQRPQRPRLLLGPGAGRDRAHRRRDAAARHRLRVDRDHLPGDPRRQLGDLGLSARHLPRVPGARRALREPRAADRDHPDRAALAGRRARRRVADPRRQQHLHADRLHGAGRPRGEERDPDRGVRARARIRRTLAGAGGDRGEPAAAAADHHDLDRLHHGRGAARLLGRRRRRDAPGDGHCGVRRHDRRHGVRHLPDAGVLRAAARAHRQPAAQAPWRGPARRAALRRRRRARSPSP